MRASCLVYAAVGDIGRRPSVLKGSLYYYWALSGRCSAVGYNVKTIRTDMTIGTHGPISIFKIHSSYPEVPNLTLNGVHIDMSQFERLSSHRGSSSQATSVEEVGVTCQ